MKFLLLALSIFLFACSEQTPIKVAGNVWPGYEFMFLARQLDSLDPSQVTLVETRSASDSLERLKSNSVDAAALTLNEVIRAIDQGIDLVVILVFDISAGADVLIAGSDIKNIEDLKNKRIGMEKGSVGLILLHQLLEICECKKSDFELVDTSINNQLSSWKKNELDAVITYEPVYTQLKKLGARKLLSSKDSESLIIDVLAVKASTLNRTDEIQHLIDAHFSALQHFNIQHQDTVYRIASHLDIQPKDVSGVFHGLFIPDLRSNKRLFEDDKSVLKTSAKKLVSILLSDHLINQHVDTSNLFNPEFLRALEQ